MRGIGDPRTIAALARLPERGLRASPKIFLRSSFSGVGRGRGIGAPKDNDDRGLGRGAGRGRGVVEEEIEEQGNRFDNDARYREWSERAHTVGVGAAPSVQQGVGRGRGIPSIPQQVAATEEGNSVVSTNSFGRGGGIPHSPQQVAVTEAGNSVVGTNAFGRGRGIPHSPQQVAATDAVNSFVSTNAFGRGRGIPHSPQQVAATDAVDSVVSTNLFGRGRGIPHSPQQVAATDAVDSVVSTNLFGRGRGIPHSPQQVAATEALNSVVNTNRFGRGRGIPHSPQQEPSSDAVSSGFIEVVGRGRGASVVPPPPPSPPSPPRVQLSAEEARARAISILQQGLEKNVAAEGERRRKAGVEKFADAAEFLTDKFKRAPGQASPQTQRSRNERERPTSASRSDRPRRQRPTQELTVTDPAVEVQLTPEQEAKLEQIQEEDTLKERLHNWFLVQFEPEYAMEEFGRNPDIDEPPVLSLEEYLESLKPMFLHENAELSEEQKWQEAVKTSLANATNLEKLVEAYAGRGRMTARQQIEKMQTISQRLPPTVSPEVAAFTQRALITLQNNPGLRFQKKEQLMTKIVSGFSS